MAIFEIRTDYQKQAALLAIFGIMIVLGTAYVATWMFAALVSPDLAIYGGLASMMITGGVMGFAVVLTDQAVKRVNIKITKEE